MFSRLALSLLALSPLAAAAPAAGGGDLATQYPPVSELPNLGQVQIRRYGQFCYNQGCTLEFFATGLSGYADGDAGFDMRCASAEHVRDWYRCEDQAPYSNQTVYARLGGYDGDDMVYRFWVSHQYPVYGDKEGRWRNVTAQGELPVGRDGPWNTFLIHADRTTCANATAYSAEYFVPEPAPTSTESA